MQKIPEKLQRKKKDGTSVLTFEPYALYILQSLLQSLLISSDFVATHQFFTGYVGEEISLGIVSDAERIVSAYESTDMYQGILAQQKDPTYFKNQPINVLRVDMFTEAEKAFETFLHKNLFNLEMPTGAGKTNTSLNLVLKALKQGVAKKAFYVFPFNTLADQTVERVKELTGGNMEVEVLNSSTKGVLRFDEGGNIDYKATLLDRQMWNYSFILTSHVNVFRVLFGLSREDSMPLFQFCNSIIILDEVQSYRNMIWREIVEFLYRYAKWLNIKIVFMSATLPNLQKLIGFDSEYFAPLIADPKRYFRADIFAKRIQEIDTSLLAEQITARRLKGKIEESVERRKQDLLNDDPSLSEEEIMQKVLVQFIKKKTAKEVWEYLEGQMDKALYKVVLLTGDDHKYERQQIIDSTKQVPERNLVIITTQLVEAGVDIDMDIGFKNKSLLDNEEQFLGRINRNGMKKFSRAYFFNWDTDREVYRGDLRIGAIHDDEQYFECLRGKDFARLYEVAFQRIRMQKDSHNYMNIETFYEELRILDHPWITDHMRLIDDETFQIFLPYQLNIEFEVDVGENKEIRREIWSGHEIWRKFVTLLKAEMGYAEKRVRLQQLREQFQYFTFSVYGIGIEKIEPVGGVYYIHDGSGFMRDNKFNRELFEEHYQIIQRGNREASSATCLDG